jgi:hypothetical protein
MMHYLRFPYHIHSVTLLFSSSLLPAPIGEGGAGWKAGQRRLPDSFIVSRGLILYAES